MTMQNNTLFNKRLKELFLDHEALIVRENHPLKLGNGIYRRFMHPVLTANHIPLSWRYDMNESTNPFLMERFGFNAVFNSGALKWKDKYLLFARVEGYDRKSFFAIAESPNGIDNFKFWDYPISLPSMDLDETNVYDLRVIVHEDGWVYGLFCSEKKDPEAPLYDTSTAMASTGIIRTKDLINWERLPNVISEHHQRNVVLHPEFVDGKYALYTSPQDDFIDAGQGGGISWSLIDDIMNAEIKTQKLIDARVYHTVQESKNGEGPQPLKTDKGWLHLAHGVRKCAAGLRYVLYLYVTDLNKPSEIIAKPAGYFMAPQGEERVGDVSNVLFSNGWIEDKDGTVYIYYASSDTRMHVAVSSVERLLDYCFNTAPDGYKSSASVEVVKNIIDENACFKSIVSR